MQYRPTHSKLQQPENIARVGCSYWLLLVHFVPSLRTERAQYLYQETELNWQHPAFSELHFPVFPTTSMVVVGLPNTGKYAEDDRIVGDRRG